MPIKKPDNSHDLFYQGLAIKTEARIVAIQQYNAYLVEEGGLYQTETVQDMEKLRIEEDHLFQLLEYIGEQPCIISF